MNETGWKYVPATALTASYVPVEFAFKAEKLKLKTTGTLTFSFNGKDDHGQIVVADGLVDFDKVGKSKIYVKGSGNYEVTAWDGN